MQTIDLLTQAKNFIDSATLKAGEYGDILLAVKSFILEHFGQNGLYASYIVVAALGLFLLSLLARLTFSTLKYLVVPSVVLAFAGSLFAPYSFVALLPVTVSVCSLFLIFKG